MPVVEPIRAFSDNYIWLIINQDNSHAVVVDPGDAQPVLDVLQSRKLTLEAILITHKHADHIGGVKILKDKTDAIVYGPAKNINNLADIELTDGASIQIKDTGISFSIIELPGHTMEHIAYINDEQLFCGDTLFVAGCGRVFEGTMQQMSESLQKLAKLPEDTKVYCAHEYTESNLRFALTVEPDNKELHDFNDYVTKIRASNQPTVPSSIKIERSINPFLRCHMATIQEKVSTHFGVALDSPVATFAYLRQWKDNF